jgi:hypothetical protein
MKKSNDSQLTVMNWLRKPVAETNPASRVSMNWTTVALYDRSLSSFVTLAADGFEMPSLVQGVSAISGVLVFTFYAVVANVTQ